MVSYEQHPASPHLAYPLVKCFGFRLWGFWFRVWGLEFGVWGLGFRAWSLGFGISDFGFRVSDLGSRVSGFGFRGLECTQHFPLLHEQLLLNLQLLPCALCPHPYRLYRYMHLRSLPCARLARSVRPPMPTSLFMWTISVQLAVSKKAQHVISHQRA